MDPKDDDVDVWHRTFAVAAFNRSWDLLDKADRTPEDDAELLRTVLAAIDDPEDRETIESQLDTIP